MWNCPFCKTEIASSADACPKCGRSFGAATAQSTAASSRVIVTGLDLPFSDLVSLLIKLTFAAIPALCIIAAVSAIIGGFTMVLLAVPARAR